MFRPSHHLLSFALVLSTLACSDNATPRANQVPRALLRAPACALAGEALSLDASGSGDDDGRILEYRFVFGDGSAERRGTAPVLQHTYDGPGAYEVVLTVADDRGQTASTRGLVRILPRTPCASETDCATGDRCEGNLCRPSTDGGVCASAPVMCPPTSQPCGTVNEQCGAMSLCVEGCCQPLKETP